MPEDTAVPPTSLPGSRADEARPSRPSPAAERALAEAAERRRQGRPDAPPPETGGRGGPEPVRYGDWEKNGIISDF